MSLLDHIVILSVFYINIVNFDLHIGRIKVECNLKQIFKRYFITLTENYMFEFFMVPRIFKEAK